MQFISDILAVKGDEVWSVNATNTVQEALRELAARGIGALPVLADGRLVGIFSERDFTRQTAGGGIDIKLPVGEVMTREVLYVSPSYSLEQCMAVMTDRRVRHLPVMEGDQLIGIVSIGDIVKGVIADQQFMIDELEKFITGKYPG